MRRILSLLVLVFLLSGTALAGEAAKPEVGQMAPDFELEGLDGTYRLSDFRGDKVVVLNFWNTWCTPCMAEIGDLNSFYQKFADKDVVVLAVNRREKKGKIEKVVQERSLSFPILLDKEDQASRLYLVRGVPFTVIIDKEGKIRFMIYGMFGFMQPQFIEQINQLLRSGDTEFKAEKTIAGLRDESIKRLKAHGIADLEESSKEFLQQYAFLIMDADGDWIIRSAEWSAAEKNWGLMLPDFLRPIWTSSRS